MAKYQPTNCTPCAFDNVNRQNKTSTHAQNRQGAGIPGQCSEKAGYHGKRQDQLSKQTNKQKETLAGWVVGTRSALYCRARRQIVLEASSYVAKS